MKKKKYNIKTMLICLAFGIVIYTVLLLIESNMTSDYALKKTVVAKQKIDRGIEITESNCSSYFEVKEVSATLVTGSCIAEPQQLVGYFVSEDIYANEIVVKERFEEKRFMVDGLSNPAEVSFNVDEFAEAVNGTVRKGDFVNVFATDIKTGESIPVALNVYISEAFTSAGVQIKPGDDSSVATSFSIFIEETAVEQFYNTTIDKKLSVSIVG